MTRSLPWLIPVRFPSSYRFVNIYSDIKPPKVYNLTQFFNGKFVSHSLSDGFQFFHNGIYDKHKKTSQISPQLERSLFPINEETRVEMEQLRRPHPRLDREERMRAMSLNL